jgi:hypothetical protein
VLELFRIRLQESEMKRAKAESIRSETKSRAERLEADLAAARAAARALAERFDAGPKQRIEIWRAASDSVLRWRAGRWSEGWTNPGALVWAKEKLIEPDINQKSADEIFHAARQTAESALAQAKAAASKFKTTLPEQTVGGQRYADALRGLAQAEEIARNFGLIRLGLMKSSDHSAGRTWADNESRRLSEAAKTLIDDKSTAKVIVDAYNAMVETEKSARTAVLENIDARRIAVEARLAIPELRTGPAGHSERAIRTRPREIDRSL